MKKNNYVFNDVAMRWLNKSVVTINVTLQLLDIYIYIYRYGYNPSKGTNGELQYFIKLFTRLKIFSNV